MLEDAAEAGRLRKEEAVLGPLDGIPFLAKRSYLIVGMRSPGPPSDNADFGDNFLTFDNLIVIPEPPALILSGFTSFCLLRRRRAN